MNNIIILIIAAFLFIPTFAIGIVLFIRALSGEFISKAVVLTHGIVAALGLSLIILYLFLGQWSMKLTASVVLIALAAMIGLSLAYLRFNRATQIALTIVHPIIAISGVIFLVVSILTKH